MDYKDLQINDWVYLSDTTRYPMRVTSIDEYGCLLDFERNGGDPFETIYGEGGIAPIPLTGEMLEMNGWSGPSAGEYYLGKDIVFLEWRADNKAFFLNDALFPYALEWVHQLQHALRLLGYSDMADKFKIQ